MLRFVTRFAPQSLAVTAASAFLAVLASLAVAPPASAAAESGLSWRQAAAASSAPVKRKPRTVTVPNCEDMVDGPVRCVMFDEGWVFVKSWDPFRAVDTRRCKSARTKLPCFTRKGDLFRVRLAR